MNIFYLKNKGHGKTEENGFESDDLQHVNLNYISNDDCTTSFDFDKTVITRYVDTNVFFQSIIVIIIQ